MLELDIPGRGRLVLTHLVLDVNGTIAEGGRLLPGVAAALRALAGTLETLAVTADTHGTAVGLAAETGITVHVIEPGSEGAQKLALISELGARGVVAIGNGANDALMLREAAVGIVVIGREGAARLALEAADLAVTDVLDALALLSDPRRLVATLRA